MQLCSRATGRLAAGALSLAVMLAIGGLAAGPAGASHKASSGISSQQLKTLTKKIKNGKKATYQATYAYKGTGSAKVSTITFAQAPPKSLFEQGTTHTLLIDTGTESLECSLTTSSSSTSSSSSTTTPSTATSATATTTTTTTTMPKPKEVCIKTGSGAAGAASGLLDLFSPTTALTFFNSAESDIYAKLAGINVKFSTANYAGLSSKCVTLKVSGESGKYCVASNGLLTYSGSSKGYFELKSFSKSVPSSDFQVPAGAKVETTP